MPIVRIPIAVARAVVAAIRAVAAVLANETARRAILAATVAAISEIAKARRRAVDTDPTSELPPQQPREDNDHEEP